MANAHGWFRLYNEFSTDAKVQSMPEAMQRRLVMLFCLRSCDVLRTLREHEIAFALHVTEQELAETKALFVDKQFIDEHWKLVNWDKRQYVSDSSTERTRKYRERARTSQKRHCDAKEIKCDASVTPPDSDTDSDTDTDTSISSKEEIHSLPRKNGAEAEAFFESEFWPNWVRAENDSKAAAKKKFLAKAKTAKVRSAIIASMAAQRSDRLATEAKFRKHASTWLNEGCWIDETGAEIKQQTAGELWPGQLGGRPAPGLVGGDW